MTKNPRGELFRAGTVYILLAYIFYEALAKFLPCTVTPKKAEGDFNVNVIGFLFFELHTNYQ